MCGRARIGADAVDHMRYVVQQQQRRRVRGGTSNNSRTTTGDHVRRDVQREGVADQITAGVNSSSGSAVAHTTIAARDSLGYRHVRLTTTEEHTAASNQIKEATTDYIDTTDYTSFIVQNVGPGSNLPVICANRRNEPSSVSRKCWGLIPSYNKSSKLDFFQMFNKRLETLRQATWKSLTESKRCVFVCDGHARCACVMSCG